MKFRIFEWEKMNEKQKVDVAFANSVFAIFLAVFLGLYILSITFKKPFLLGAGCIIFLIGIFLLRKFLKRAAQVPGGGPVLAPIKKQLDERIRVNTSKGLLKKNESNKTKDKSQPREETHLHQVTCYLFALKE